MFMKRNRSLNKNKAFSELDVLAAKKQKDHKSLLFIIQSLKAIQEGKSKSINYTGIQ